MYRLYTESKPNLAEILGRYVHAFTLIEAVGCWNLQIEKSAIIELADISLETAKQIAAEIKRLNSQEAVLIAEISERTTLIV
ncbi:hypothetical protein HYR54_14855 [Candidatus Acetothermia bacterium]|nr:hypothetical protein [Candidatus Acetothermia bacterium]